MTMGKKKKKSVNAQPIRLTILANGPIQIQVKGTKKGKKGYNRKNKNWKKDQ
jgi:hypothetical protein